MARTIGPMVEQKEGVIVHVTSLAGKNTFAAGAVYSAWKHAVLTAAP